MYSPMPAPRAAGWVSDLVMLEAEELVEDPRAERRGNARTGVADADRHAGPVLYGRSTQIALSTVMLPPAGVYLSAFDRMLSKTARRRSASPEMRGRSWIDDATGRQCPARSPVPRRAGAASAIKSRQVHSARG